MAGESELVQAHLPCPGCESSDAFALYDDGHGYCHSCNTDFQPRKLASLGYEVDPEAVSADSFHKHAGKARPKMSEDLQNLIDSSTVSNLSRRGISQATCEHCDYRVRINSRGEGEEIAIYRNEAGVPVAAKVRNKGKDGTAKEFSWVGDPKAAGLYGLHQILGGGKMLVVSEGEIDRLTASELWANKFPTAGVPNGAANARKDVAKALEVLSRFERVVFAFDMDGPGRDAAAACARMLPPGKAFIANIPGGKKDINEAHLAGLDRELTGAFHNALEYRPDGIVSADDLDAEVLNPVQTGLSFPYPFMTKWTYGQRGGEVIIIGAGTGVGKSDLMAEIGAHNIRPHGDGGNYAPGALFNYESGSVQSYKGILGKLWSKRFHIPDPEDGTPNLYWTPEELRAASDYRRNQCASLFINDHKGAISWDSVKERLRYLAHAHGVRWGVVDPMAAMVAQEDDERKALDRMLAEAKALAEELGITLFFVSHLARPAEGKSHEEGGRVTLRNFRGSGAIVMWASFVFAMERDQQSEDEDKRGVTTVRVLKDRFTGDSTGKTQAMRYDTLTGRLIVSDVSLGGEGLSSSSAPAELDQATLEDYT